MGQIALFMQGQRDRVRQHHSACQMRELCCYLLIPELPLEHRSGSVSRSAPCTGTTLPADRKARLASHKEANIEEHFLSRRGFVRRTRSNPLSWQRTVTNTHTGRPTLGNAWKIGIWFLWHTHTHAWLPTHNPTVQTHTCAPTRYQRKSDTHFSFFGHFDLCSIMKYNC